MSEKDHRTQKAGGERILVVDDEESIRRVLSVILSKENFLVDVASGGVEAIKKASYNTYDLVICDIRMSEMDGFKVLNELKKLPNAPTVILMTAFGSLETAIEAIRSGAYDYFSKPINAKEMLHRVFKALEQRNLSKDFESLNEEFQRRYGLDNIIGKSSLMQEIYCKVLRVARYKSTVLISGESGTGKELVARAIHYHSSRSNKRFLAINCGALPGDLLESELFGHVKGAFSGAIVTKRGLFEEANGGTLLLDEVGELCPSSQVKLLRVLQEGEVRRVGGNEMINIDVRVIASTEKDLSEEVTRGTFREGLYYRLNVVSIHIPPLRARKEDIPLLVKHFIEKYCRENNRPLLDFSKEALEMVMDYQWPGNVRELENAIERAVVLADGSSITPRDLPLHITEMQKKITVSIPESYYNLKKVLVDVTSTVEKQMILRALRKTEGNRTRAARLLGISHRSLMYKIKDYEIN